MAYRPNNIYQLFKNHVFDKLIILVCEMTYYVSSGTLNPIHSLS